VRKRVRTATKRESFSFSDETGRVVFENRTDVITDTNNRFENVDYL